MRRTWAEIDLDALEWNYRLARERIGPHVRYLGVVKADAYGHGAIQIARKLETLRCDYLAVSSLDEARELRRGGVKTPILILGHTPPEMTAELLRYDITQAASALAKAEAFSAAAQELKGTLRVHIKVDTGMSRLGFLVGGEHFLSGVEAIDRACGLPGLEPEGIFTHFSSADSAEPSDQAYTAEQFRLFTAVLDALEKRGRRFSLRHCANSGALERYPETYLDMVRPGIALYGAGEEARAMGMRPVMSLKSCVSTIKIFDHQLWPHVLHGEKTAGGGTPHRLRGRTVPRPVQPGQRNNRRRSGPHFGENLHGYDDGRPERSAQCPCGKRGGNFRRAAVSGRAGGGAGYDPL